MTLPGLGAWWTATVLPWAIDSTLVALILLGVLRLTRTAAPAFRNAIALLGLTKMALPPQILPVGLLSMGVVGGAEDPVAPLGAPLAGPAMKLVAIVHLLGVAVGLLFLARRVNELHGIKASGMSAGVTVDELVAALGRRIGLRRRPKILASDRVSAPFVTGLLRPTIVLPRKLATSGDLDTLRGLLAHELLHLRRGDLWTSWARALVVALWWPSPFARALARAQERSTEELCDDAVLGGGLSTAHSYATGLLTVATLAAHRRGGLVASAAGASGLESRILRIASPPDRRRGRSACLAVLALAVLLLPATTTGRVSPTGLTTSVHFVHGQVTPSATTAATDHRHHHNH